MDTHPSTDEPLVITLRRDSFECPRCGTIVVATDDLTVDLARSHACR